MGRGLRWFLGALVLLVACSQTRTEEEQAGSQGSGAAALAFLDRVRASHASRGAHMPSLALASQSDVRRQGAPAGPVGLPSLARLREGDKGLLEGAVERTQSREEGDESRQERRMKDQPCRGHIDCAASSGLFCAAGSGVQQLCKECRECTENGAAVDGKCPADCAQAAPEPDNSAPNMGWLFVDDRTSLGSNRLVTVDLPDKLGGRTFVDIYLYVSDVGSGVRQATMTFTSTTQSGFTSAIKTAAFAPRDVFSGSTHSGVMKASSWFEFSDEPGRWGLRSVVLEDNAGNWRIYTDLDLLLFAHMVNATLDVHGSEDQYLGCDEAKKMRCVSNATCYNQCHDKDKKCFGKCACKPGFSGNEFACMKSELLASRWANGMIPSGEVYLADDRATSHEQNGDSFMMNAEEIVGREKAGKPLAETNKSPAPGGATATNASKEPKGIASGNVAFTLVTCLLVLCCLLIFQYVWRKHLSHMGSFLVLSAQRRNRRRTNPAAQDLPLRLQAWQHDNDLSLNPATAENRRRAESMARLGLSNDEVELMTWAAVLNEQEQHSRIQRLRVAGSDVSPTNVRRPQYNAPRAPTEISLPAHLQPKPSLPGAVGVEEEVAEGQECCVCMERRKNTRLVPCGHTDLCHGCAEHLHRHGSLCPVCRTKIMSVSLL